MADSKITALASIGTGTDPANDQLVIVDVSDVLPTGMALSGTTKRVGLNQLLSSSPTATGAFSVTGLVTAGSATITGDLTAARLIVTGGTIPTNGLWLATTNTLEFAANSLAQYRIAPLGVFSWYDGAGGTRMTLNSTGLGVGQSPSDKFNVRVTPASSSFGGMTVNDATNAVGLFITGSAYNSFGVGANSGWVYAATNNLAIGPFGAGYVSIVSNGSERMRVDTSGNVGIGVTPLYKFHAVVTSGAVGAFRATTAAIARLLVGNTVEDVELKVNANGDGQLTANASKYLGLGSGGINDRVILDTSGNLLVGLATAGTTAAKTIQIANGTAPTANVTGGQLYVEAGALKFRGSSGTITTIANA